MDRCSSKEHAKNDLSHPIQFRRHFFFFQLGLSFLGPSSSSHSLYQRPAENLGLGSCPFDSKTNWTHISHVSVINRDEIINAYLTRFIVKIERFFCRMRHACCLISSLFLFPYDSKPIINDDRWIDDERQFFSFFFFFLPFSSFFFYFFLFFLFSSCNKTWRGFKTIFIQIEQIKKWTREL